GSGVSKERNQPLRRYPPPARLPENSRKNLFRASPCFGALYTRFKSSEQKAFLQEGPVSNGGRSQVFRLNSIQSTLKFKEDDTYRNEPERSAKCGVPERSL